MSKGLFIGRFQPFHLGHLSVVERCLKEVDELIIGVGISKSINAENPFDYDERKSMIENSISGNYKILPIPDINDDARWVDHVKVIVGEFDYVYTGNPHVRSLFEEKNYSVKLIVGNDTISASKIRKMVAYKSPKWKNHVPSGTSNIIGRINGEEKIRSTYMYYMNPVPAVDAIIEYGNGIVLIKRRDGQWAIPGGFVDYNEKVEDAVVREAREETGLKFDVEGLVGVYSDPVRDTRDHIMGISFYGKGSGELNHGDDAMDAKIVSIEEALKMNLAFDHNKILQDYSKRRLLI